MHRSVLSVLAAGVFAASLAVSGCGGGGIDEGMPTGEIKVPEIPENVKKPMGAPPKKLPEPGKIEPAKTEAK